ncbi:MAG TPA: hypothetical protein VHX38_40195 [Pseudonocardiaceae bacterium]|nr:hypothetical protein [Pseudonocardiaceae bacterium]
MDLAELTDKLVAVSGGYARRYRVVQDDNWFVLKLQEEMGELTQAYLMRAGQARDKGLSAEEIEAHFRAEVADVVGQALVVARHFGVDPEAELERKWLAWGPDQQRMGQHPADQQPASE